MTRIALLALCLLATGAAPPRQEAIAMTTNSWGKALSSWTIQPDGSIDYSYALENDKPAAGPGDFGHYKMATKRTKASPPRYAWIADLLRPVRDGLGQPYPCGERVTDMVYGDLSWGEGGGKVTLAYDNGCMNPRSRQMLARLHRAQTQIENWTQPEPIASTRDVRPD